MTEIVEQCGKKWYALYTKPRQEFQAEIQLSAVSVDNYLPTIVVEKKWSDRKKKIIEPLFHGYIFIHATEKERLISLQQKAIVRTIGFNGKPAVIPDWQIESVRIMLSSKSEIKISDKIEIGSSVEITDGPFSGVIGKVREVSNEKWLIVSIDLLKRSIMVHLPIESTVKFIKK